MVGLFGFELVLPAPWGFQELHGSSGSQGRSLRIRGLEAALSVLRDELPTARWECLATVKVTGRSWEKP